MRFCAASIAGIWTSTVTVLFCLQEMNLFGEREQKWPATVIIDARSKPWKVSESVGLRHRQLPGTGGARQRPICHSWTSVTDNISSAVIDGALAGATMAVTCRVIATLHEELVQLSHFGRLSMSLLYCISFAFHLITDRISLCTRISQILTYFAYCSVFVLILVSLSSAVLILGECYYGVLFCF